MGYYGLGPGMRVAEQLTPYEKALRGMQVWQPSLDIMEKLLRNIAQNPKEEKFRKIRLTNAKIFDTITSVPYAVQALYEIGWVFDGEESLVLPPNIDMTMPKHVSPVIDARQYYKKEEEKVRVSRGMSRVAPGGQDWKSLFQDDRSGEQKKADGDAMLERLRQGQVVCSENYTGEQHNPGHARGVW